MTREETVIEYTPARGARRRVRYIDDSLTGEPQRIEEVWTGCDWRRVGAEPIAHLDIDA